MSAYRCGACNKKVKEGAKFCSNCGAKLKWSKKNSVSYKSKKSDEEKLRIIHGVIGAIFGIIILVSSILIYVNTRPSEEEVRKKLADRYNDELTTCYLTASALMKSDKPYVYTCSLTYIEDKNGHAIGVNIWRRKSKGFGETITNEIYFTTNK